MTTAFSSRSDLMPADILGSEVLETAADGSRDFRFIEGPIFCQLLMADEINRASPRTQAALLQAMQERLCHFWQSSPLGQTISRAGHTEPDRTGRRGSSARSPVGPLPCADRRALPDRATEREILLATTGVSEDSAHQVFDAQTLLAAQTTLRRMPVGEAVMDLILDLVQRHAAPARLTHPPMLPRNVSWGPRPMIAAQSDADGARQGPARRTAGAFTDKTWSTVGRAGAHPSHGSDLCRPCPRGGSGRDHPQYGRKRDSR